MSNKRISKIATLASTVVLGLSAVAVPVATGTNALAATNAPTATSTSTSSNTSTPTGSNAPAGTSTPAANTSTNPATATDTPGDSGSEVPLTDEELSMRSAFPEAAISISQADLATAVNAASFDKFFEGTKPIDASYQDVQNDAFLDKLSAGHFKATTDEVANTSYYSFTYQSASVQPNLDATDFAQQLSQMKPGDSIVFTIHMDDMLNGKANTIARKTVTLTVAGASTPEATAALTVPDFNAAANATLTNFEDASLIAPAITDLNGKAPFTATDITNAAKEVSGSDTGYFYKIADSSDAFASLQTIKAGTTYTQLVPVPYTTDIAKAYHFDYYYDAATKLPTTTAVTPSDTAVAFVSRKVVVAPAAAVIPAPVITLNDGTTQDVTVDASATPYDLMKGVKAAASSEQDAETLTPTVSVVDANKQPVSIEGNMLDISKAGTYTVTYTATNEGGKTVELVRVITVNAISNNGPVINLSDGTQQNVTLDPSLEGYDLLKGVNAYASSEKDAASLTPDITVTDASGKSVNVNNNLLDISKHGVYTVNYAVKNEAGLTAYLTRIITVNESAPVITLANGTEQNPTLDVNTKGYNLMQGITAVSSNEIGAVTVMPIITVTDATGAAVEISNNMLDISKAGVYTVVYSVTNGDKQTSTFQRTITVSEPKPVITLADGVEQNPTVNVSKDGYDLMKGVSAVASSESGAVAVTPTISVVDANNQPVTIEDNMLDISKAGIYTVTYTATNKAGQTVTYTRMINVKINSNGAPVFSLADGTEQNPSIETSSTSYDLLQGVNVLASSDAGAATITPTVEVTDENGNAVTVTDNKLDVSKAGTYFVVYEATNEAGKTRNYIRVIKVNTGAPIFTLANGTEQNPTVGMSKDGYDLMQGVTALASSENGAATIMPRISVTDANGDLVAVKNNMLDISKPGIYTVVYSATNEAGKVSSYIRQITVREGKPVFTLAKGTEQNPTLETSKDGYDVLQGLTVTESSAEGAAKITPVMSVTDAEGNAVELNGNILDISKAGTYTVNYRALNDEGITGTYTRVITVKAGSVTPPVTPSTDYTETPLDDVATINFVPGYGTLVYDAPDGNSTGQYLEHGTAWQVWSKAVINKSGEVWYNVGRDQWIRAKYALLEDENAADSKVTDFNGTALINYVPGYGINLWHGYGLDAQFSGRRLEHGTAWKIFKKAVTNDGIVWYNLGGNQWILAEYAIVY